MEDRQEDSHHVILAKVVDLFVLVDVVVHSDVSDSLSKQEKVDSRIEVATVVENEQQPLDSSTKEIATCSPP